MGTELQMLDIEGTSLDPKVSANWHKKLEQIKEHIELGIENTILYLGGNYITSTNNAADLTDMYGWHFSKLVIVDM